MVIIGESALYGDIGEYVFETLKDFLVKNNFITKPTRYRSQDSVKTRLTMRSIVFRQQNR